jgi:hypothetical protein
LALLAGGVLAAPNATADTGATLVRAEVSFHTNDEDKDDDTQVTVTVRDKDGGTAAQVSADWAHFDDNSDAGPFPLTVQQGRSWESMTAGRTTIAIDPNGHDTWRFNFHVDLVFSDGSHLDEDVRGVQLTQDDDQRTWPIQQSDDDYYQRLDYSWVPQPHTVVDSVRLAQDRRIPALLWGACVPRDTSGRGEDYMAHVVAKAGLLRLVEDPDGRAELANAFTATPPLRDPKQLYRNCLSRLAHDWQPPAAGQPDKLTTTPGWTEVIADMRRVPAFTGKPGTDSFPLCRTSGGDTDEWDFTMALLMRVWGIVRQEPLTTLFGSADQAAMDQLRTDVAGRAWLQGSKADIDASICSSMGPETENHEWLIRTTRFLHNEQLPVVALPSDPEYVNKYDIDGNSDNTGNGLDAYIHGFLSDVLDHDWQEYNAHPYSRYEMIGLLNIYDFAGDQSIKQDAANVLNFMMLKHASESMDNERIEPFRRRLEKESDLLYQDGSTDSMAEVWVGGLPEPVLPPQMVSEEMALAASATYQPPTWLVDQMLGRTHRDYVEHFDGKGQDEVAYGGADYVLTGGGRHTDCPYPNVLGCAGSGNDPGTVEPIVLIPRQARTAKADELGLPTYADAVRLGNGGAAYASCVDREIACGATLGVPDDIVRASADCRVDFTQDDQARITALRFDDACSPTPGAAPSYAGDCFFVYATSYPGSIPFSYLVTHSCDPTQDQAARTHAFQGFVTYMKTVGRARDVTVDICGLAQLQFDLTVEQPQGTVVDLTGTTSGHPVQLGYHQCAATYWVAGGTPVTAGRSVSGDLGPNGGRYPLTTIALTSTRNAVSATGQPVPLTATVTPAGVTGSVTFLDGSQLLGTAPVAADGTAKLTASSQATGRHRFSAVYSGDATHVASVADLVHTVRPSFTGLWSMSQANGFTVRLVVAPADSAGNFVGVASYPRMVGVIRSGHISDHDVVFDIVWADGRQGRYTGYPDRRGGWSGTSYDLAVPSVTVAWSAVRA